MSHSISMNLDVSTHVSFYLTFQFSASRHGTDVTSTIIAKAVWDDDNHDSTES